MKLRENFKNNIHKRRGNMKFKETYCTSYLPIMIEYRVNRLIHAIKTADFDEKLSLDNWKKIFGEKADRICDFAENEKMSAVVVEVSYLDNFADVVMVSKKIKENWIVDIRKVHIGNKNDKAGHYRTLLSNEDGKIYLHLLSKNDNKPEAPTLLK